MTNKHKIVVKVEIETLFNGNGQVSLEKMDHLAMVCANLQNSGLQLMIVSSGAIVLGTARLGFEHQPMGIVQKQAVSAVGQAELMRLYQLCFDGFDQMVAQVLLTQDAITNPVRNRNAMATFEKLLEKGVIPVINENDSVSTDDIIENDNYPLTLIVANITRAAAIIVKTKREGMYQLILKDNSHVYRITEEMLYNLKDWIEGGSYRADEGFCGFPDQIDEDKVESLSI